MVAPGLLAIAAPVVMGLIDLGALGGMLVGVTVSGVLQLSSSRIRVELGTTRRNSLSG